MKRKPNLFKILFILLLTVSGLTELAGQSRELPKIHSHNDYHQMAPFWLAYSAGAASIEIDVILQDNQLFVAHDPEDIKSERTIENLYFDQIKKLKDDKRPVHEIQFLVDLKTEACSTIDKLVEIAENYPELFNESPTSVIMIVSGNRPIQKDYTKYPQFILFDGRNHEEIPEEGGEKIGLISRNFSDFTQWRGFGELPENDSLKIVNFVNGCHSQNRPVRFWNTKDNKVVYQKLFDFGVDFMNTDYPFQLKKFLDQYNSEKH